MKKLSLCKKIKPKHQMFLIKEVLFLKACNFYKMIDNEITAIILKIGCYEIKPRATIDPTSVKILHVISLILLTVEMFGVC